MGPKYFLGTNFAWIEQFQNAIPVKRGLSRTTVFCLALMLAHLYKIHNSPEFSINRKTLSQFGLNRHSFKIYLKYFQDAGLIQVIFENSKAPKITLLAPPVHIGTKRKARNKEKE